MNLLYKQNSIIFRLKKHSVIDEIQKLHRQVINNTNVLGALDIIICTQSSLESGKILSGIILSSEALAY